MENIWRGFLQLFGSEEDGQLTLQHYTREISNQVEAFLTGTLKTSQNAAELWQMNAQELQKLHQLWLTAWGASIKSLSQTEALKAGNPWIELNHFYWNLLYEKTLGPLSQVPLLGPSRSFNHKFMQVFDAWAQLYPTSVDYQIVLAEIQMQSFLQLMQELNSLAAKGETIKDWQQFEQLWGRIVDQVFEQAFCLEDNLKVRGKLLNAMNHYKLQQQELLESWMNLMNLPTRSEIDEIHQSIYELRKEVKRLKSSSATHKVEDVS